MTMHEHWHRPFDTHDSRTDEETAADIARDKAREESGLPGWMETSEEQRERWDRELLEEERRGGE